MTEQEFRELKQRVFSAFVEQHAEERIEVCEFYPGGAANNLLYIHSVGAKIEACPEQKEFVFTSFQPSMKVRISVGFYMQDQEEFNEAYFISGANKLFVAFLKSARTICDAKSELLMTEAYVNGYPF